MQHSIDSVHHLGLYIHIPLCSKKCSYCDFYSVEESAVNSNFWLGYFAKLKNDLEFFLPLISPKARLGSIFFGGGTPSLIEPNLLEDFLQYVFQVFQNRIFDKVEITLEANPENITPALLQKWKKISINRLHIGIQANQNHLLAYLERQATGERNLQALSYVKESSFENYGMDIMYGLPNQTQKDILETLQAGIKAQVSHVSAYALTLEENTRLTLQTQAGKKKLPLDDLSVPQSIVIENFLKKNSFVRYEISNYARKRKASLHNLGYWKFRPYIGVGSSAHAFLYNNRYRWSKSLQGYLQQNKPQVEKASAIDLWIGFLRLYNWQSHNYISKSFLNSNYKKFLVWLEDMNKKNLLEKSGRQFKLSRNMIDFADDFVLQAVDYLK